MDKSTLLYYMPNYYKDSKVIDAINNANALELTAANKNIESTLNQFFLTTTDTSISRWEKEFGIKSDANKSLQERVNRILAKLRGLGTSTVQTIKNIALSYVDEVDVVENNPNNSFTLDLISNNGFPYILEDLYEIIEEIKPAHLQANYGMTSILNSKLYYGASCIIGQKITVYPWQTKTLQSKAQINISPGVNRGSSTITIYPKGGV